MMKMESCICQSPNFLYNSLAPKVITDVMTILDYALQESLVLQNSIQRGRLLVSIAHGYIEALKVGEMEQRLEAVEMTLKMRKEQKR